MTSRFLPPPPTPPSLPPSLPLPCLLTSLAQHGRGQLTRGPRRDARDKVKDGGKVGGYLGREGGREGEREGGREGVGKQDGHIGGTEEEIVERNDNTIQVDQNSALQSESERMRWLFPSSLFPPQPPPLPSSLPPSLPPSPRTAHRRTLSPLPRM